MAAGRAWARTMDARRHADQIMSTAPRAILSRRSTPAWQPTRAKLVSMITQAERAAEKRRVKLEEIQRQLQEGSLKIRKMTAKERKSFPPRPSKGPAKGAKAPRR
jgi:hypothetical protein